MDNEAVYIMSQVICAMITAQGMTAENESCKMQGQYPKFTMDDFERVINDHGIHHNGVIEKLYGR